ncbi:hypothetical protein C8Q70DRAFT_1056727 [Cubamyces menziesii]|nr:hypothetical protein C8Q70DRAFT_1056727 [Cubamyces menziesii]
MANQSLATSLQPLRYDEPEAFALPSLSGTIGIYTIGTFASLILYGISCHQFYRYGRLHSKDNAYLKALVIILMLLETLHSVAPMHSCYYFLIKNRFNLIAAENGVWSLDIEPAVSGAISFLAFIFFACRVSLIGVKSSIVALTAILLLLASNGLLTGTLQWTAALMSFKFPLDFYWAALTLITMKLRTMILLSVLNSRKTMASRGITVFNNSSYTRNAIARAHRLAVVEQFNVPRDPCEDVPPVISIKVVAETEVHGPHYGSSSVDNDSEAGC